MHRASGQIVQKQGVYSHDFLFDKYIRLFDEITRLYWYFYKNKTKEFEKFEKVDELS